MTSTHAVLFDYGHTIIDFSPAEENLLACYEEVRRMLEVRAYRDLPEAPALVEQISRRVESLIVESYSAAELEELDIVQLFETALQTAGVSLPRELVREIVEMEHRALISSLFVEQDNVEVLRELKSRGKKIGIVSNATFLPDLMHQDIRTLGIAEHVDCAVFSSEIGIRKPHPAIYRHVLDSLAVQPGDAVFVGDRLHDDLYGAKSLGMRGILTRQFRQEDPATSPVNPDYIVQSLPEILPYILAD